MFSAEGANYAVTFSLAFGIAFAVVLLSWLCSTTADQIPTVNSYPWDWGQKKAHQQYLSNSRSLIKEGIRRVHQPSIDLLLEEPPGLINVRVVQ